MNEFTETVWGYYAKYGRDLPWRQPEADGSFDPYKILVSEIMLQQTQASRVISKYQEFLQLFPNVESLADSRLGDVLRAWQGLGYNRRAKFLWQAAQMVVTEFGGLFPKDQKELTKLPGVGINTAGAICAYAFNLPVVFVETNIRSVYIHHFFTDQGGIDDKQLIPIIIETLDHENPREWYWALMDYGSHLKTKHGNSARASKHYVKQSKFEGSRRQIRGQVLRLLSQGKSSTENLHNQISDPRTKLVLEELESEGLIIKKGSSYSLS